MAVVLFFLFCITIFICGLIYVGLTLRHHSQLDRQKREQAESVNLSTSTLRSDGKQGA